MSVAITGRGELDLTRAAGVLPRDPSSDAARTPPPACMKSRDGCTLDAAVAVLGLDGDGDSDGPCGENGALHTEEQSEDEEDIDQMLRDFLKQSSNDDPINVEFAEARKARDVVRATRAVPQPKRSKAKSAYELFLEEQKSEARVAGQGGRQAEEAGQGSRPGSQASLYRHFWQARRLLEVENYSWGHGQYLF